VARGQLADRTLPGEVPVHRAAGPVHQLLQLGEQRHLAEQVLRGAGAAAEQRAEAEGVRTRGLRTARGIPALRVVALVVAIGEPEAERQVAHATTVDA
jgi:hypothetical protein